MFLTKAQLKAHAHFILSICSPNLPVRCAPSLRSFSFLKVYLIFIYLLVYRYRHQWMPRTPAESVRSSGAGKTVGCEPLNVGAANQTLVVWNSRKCS